MKRFFNWLKNLFSTQAASPRNKLTQSGSCLRQTNSQLKPGSAKIRQAVPQRQPEYVNLDPSSAGRLVDGGSGKTVLARNKYIREDSGTHETLRILDDSITQPDDEIGTDPYDTTNPDHLAYHARNRERGRMSGQLRIRVRYGSYCSPWFDYLLASREEVQEIASGTGWVVERFLGEGGRYVAVMEKEAR